MDDAPLEQDEAPIVWSTTLSSCGDSPAGSATVETFPTADPDDQPNRASSGWA